MDRTDMNLMHKITTKIIDRNSKKTKKYLKKVSHGFDSKKKPLSRDEAERILTHVIALADANKSVLSENIDSIINKDPKYNQYKKDLEEVTKYENKANAARERMVRLENSINSDETLLAEVKKNAHTINVEQDEVMKRNSNQDLYSTLKNKRT